MAQLSVNIDHIATIRQARYRATTDYGEPDVVRLAHEVEVAGADGITVHLREDRRHITDRDVHMLRETVRVRFNFEMGATEEMIGIAAKVRPHSAMLVPEGRHEVTTEGGLDVAAQSSRLKDVVATLKQAGCIVSAFIDAQERQVVAAREAGFDVCEVHTGPYAAAFLSSGGDFLSASLRAEHDRVRRTGQMIVESGMRFNAGHALNYHNVGAIAAIQGVSELHIGHAIIARAVLTGIGAAVREMKAAMAAGQQPSRTLHDARDRA
jgi:pyridoxine 5-phosphate synthase